MQMLGDKGTHIIPELWRTMNAIWEGVIADAAIIRSPSFSRSGESRTTRNSPARKEAMQLSIGSKRADFGVVVVVPLVYVVVIAMMLFGVY